MIISNSSINSQQLRETHTVVSPIHRNTRNISTKHLFASLSYETLVSFNRNHYELSKKSPATIFESKFWMRISLWFEQMMYQIYIWTEHIGKGAFLSFEFYTWQPLYGKAVNIFYQLVSNQILRPEKRSFLWRNNLKISEMENFYGFLSGIGKKSNLSMNKVARTFCEITWSTSSYMYISMFLIRASVYTINENQILPVINPG